MDQGNLLPFKREAIAAGVYEQEIEDLLWDNLGTHRRHPPPATPRVGCRHRGKRDVVRNQLAQALEYASWPRRTNLDVLAC